MTTYVVMEKSNSGDFNDDPTKGVDHTTETWSDPRNWISGWAYSSHEVWDYERDLVVKCVGWHKAARTLYNASGGADTNRGGARQIEINGYAVNPADPARPDWPDAKYRWIAKQWARVQAELIDEGITPINFSHWHGDTTYGGSASEFADQRVSGSHYMVCDGLMGHNNVPENDHWDPGLINRAKLVQYILEELDDKEPPVEEEEVAEFVPDKRVGGPYSATFTASPGVPGGQMEADVYVFTWLPPGAVIRLQRLDTWGGTPSIITNTKTGVVLGTPAFWHPDGIGSVVVPATPADASWSVWVPKGTPAIIKAYK